MRHAVPQWAHRPAAALGRSQPDRPLACRSPPTLPHRQLERLRRLSAQLRPPPPAAAHGATQPVGPRRHPAHGQPSHGRRSHLSGCHQHPQRASHGRRRPHIDRRPPPHARPARRALRAAHPLRLHALAVRRHRPRPQWRIWSLVHRPQRTMAPPQGSPSPDPLPRR